MDPHTKDATVSLPLTYAISAGVASVAIALSALHRVLWGGGGLIQDWRFWVLVAAGVFVHEGLHGLGYRLGGARRGAVRFGFAWSKLMPYAHCTTPLTARAYRRAVVAPGLLLGLAPLLFGLTSGEAPWTQYGMVHLALAGGDAAVLWSIRSVPAHAAVLDHPSAVGCHVLGPV